MSAPIPYSRSAASLPPRATKTPRKHLFHKISSLSLFDKKPTAETWHKQIDETANGVKPVAANGDTCAFVLFPRAQLRLHTDNFLRKNKIPEAEYDGVLTGMINEHADKVTAFAACAHALSELAVADVLTAFSRQEHGPEDFLQAFVAASHDNDHDMAWAITLVRVHTAATTSGRLEEALHFLYIHSCMTLLPTNSTLRAKLPDIVKLLLRKIAAALNECRKQQDWMAAVPIQRVISMIDEGINGRSAFLEELLQVEVPFWRHWASWQPDTNRLKSWQPKSQDWLRPLWKLIGPNFEFIDGVHVSTLSRLILDKRLIPWLEQNGVTIGPGLLVNDTPDAQTAFTARLFAVLDFVCAEGGLAETFFLHLWLDDRLGLDEHTLDLWESARMSLFTRAPVFLQGVLQGGSDRGDPTSTLSLGLSALDHVAFKDLRTYLDKDIRHFITEAYSNLSSSFLTELQAENDWFLTASAVAQVRSTLAKFLWLSDMESEVLHLLPASLITLTSLSALQELHQAIEWPDDVLEPLTRAYIGKVVLGQPCGEDSGLTIINELHNLWKRPDLRSFRSCSLKLAQIPQIPAAHQAICIQDLHTFSDTQVKKLEDTMLGLKYKPADMCHCVVRLGAKAVRRTPAHRSSWASLVRHVLETYNISPRYAVSDRLLTTYGFAKYRSWVQNLHCVFGDLVEDVEESLRWLDTLSGLKEVLARLHKIPESQRAFHCIVTSYGSVFSAHVVEMLQSIQNQSNKERSELMCHLMLSLTEKSLAKQFSETICLLSSISEAGFATCQELIVLSDRESVYVAAVQMEVWLQSEALGEDIKKALT